MKSEIEAAQTDLAALEQDKPKFVALLEQHQANATAAGIEAIAATKNGNLEQASKLLAKASTLEAQAASVQSMLVQHQAEINGAQSRVWELEAQAERAETIARIAGVARAANMHARGIETETLAALEHLAALTQKTIMHRAAWQAQSLEWSELLPSLGITPPHLIREHDPKRASALHAAHRAFVGELETLGIPTEAVQTPPTRLDETPFRTHEPDASNPTSAAKAALKHFFLALQDVQEYQESRIK